MFSRLRAGLGAALFAIVSFSAAAADKPFQRDDLADSAIRLEAKIKADSGTVAKPAVALKREADELRLLKTDRAALAALFTEVAMRLNDEFDLPGSEHLGND